MFKFSISDKARAALSAPVLVAAGVCFIYAYHPNILDTMKNLTKDVHFKVMPEKGSSINEKSSIDSDEYIQAIRKIKLDVLADRKENSSFRTNLSRSSTIIAKNSDAIRQNGTEIGQIQDTLKVLWEELSNKESEKTSKFEVLADSAVNSETEVGRKPVQNVSDTVKPGIRLSAKIKKLENKLVLSGENLFAKGEFSLSSLEGLNFDQNFLDLLKRWQTHAKRSNKALAVGIHGHSSPQFQNKPQNPRTRKSVAARVNYRLSYKRSDAMKSYVENQFKTQLENSTTVTTKAYGHSQPILGSEVRGPCGQFDCEKSRRVEISFQLFEPQIEGKKIEVDHENE